MLATRINVDCREIVASLVRARDDYVDAVQLATIALQTREHALQALCGQKVGHLRANVDVGGAVWPACAICAKPMPSPHVSDAPSQPEAIESFNKRSLFAAWLEKHAPLGSRLAVERRRLNLTQERLGFLIDVSASIVSDWERNVAHPRAHHTLRLQAIGMDIEFLITGTRLDASKARLQSEAAATELRLQGYAVVLP